MTKINFESIFVKVMKENKDAINYLKGNKNKH